MRGLVGDKLHAAKLLIERGVLAEEHLAVVVERSSRVLHAAILEAGEHDKVILGKGVGDARVLLQPLQRCRHLLEDGVQLRKALGVGLAVVCRKAMVAIIVGAAIELARHKREEVGAQRLCGSENYGVTLHVAHCGIRHRHPTLRKCQR